MQQESQQEQDIQGSETPPSGNFYILRTWREGDGTTGAFRASIRKGTDGPRRYFAHMDDVLEFVYAELLRT
ncbi:hypothetical protein [Deinococcus pimensis]|uniref:hypothetical protein n=1 Tax=Deinococcus pimensis TaxID=309888 RepID=UPI0004AC880C|nr:hypothetical protein [Deinococcus pimensis]